MPVYSRSDGQPKEYVSARYARRADGVVRQIVGNPPSSRNRTSSRRDLCTHARARVGLTQGGSAYAADDGTFRNVSRRDGASHDRLLHCVQRAI